MTITAESASWNETVDADEVTRALSEVAKAASVRRGVPAALLEGYPQALLSVARTGRQLSAEEEATCRRRGGDAVAMGVGLPALVDAHRTLHDGRGPGCPSSSAPRVAGRFAQRSCSGWARRSGGLPMPRLPL